jgi:hypothetical protein
MLRLNNMAPDRRQHGRPKSARRNRAGVRVVGEAMEHRVLLSAIHHLHHGAQPSVAVEPAFVPPILDIVTGTGGADTINLVRDLDGQHIDWSLNGGGVNTVAITDPNGLAINGNGGADTITLDYTNGNPLPNSVSLYGRFTVNGLTGPNPLAGTSLNINHSTVFISYGGSDPIASVKTYLSNGYNGGSWNGTPTMLTGVITSSAAAADPGRKTGVGFADSADGTGVNSTPNTIELAYELYGDDTLNGGVDIFDLNALLPNFNKSGDWTGGDSNYTGNVDIFDLNAMLPNFNTTLRQIPNDNVADALPIAGTSVTSTGSNVGATKEPGEPNHANNSGGASIWWKWYSTSAGRVVVSTAGSSFDTTLGIYTRIGNGPLNWVASNDDSLAGGTLTSLARFNAVAGKTYYIAIDGYNGATGNVNLNVTLGPALLAGIEGRVSTLGQVWVGTSNGTSFTNSLWDTWSPAVTWVDVHTGDFNGDGKTDLVERDSVTGKWYVSLSTGAGYSTSLWATWFPGITWVDVQVGDFNGDGRDDIVGRNSATGEWWVGISTGSAFNTSLWATWSPNFTWVDVHVGDFNGDGRADIVGRDSATGNWWVGLSTGSSFTASLWTTWNSGITWVDVQIGDFNGDGLADIVGRDSATGKWWVGLSNGSGFSNANWTSWNSAVTWVDVHVGDFNGDGMSDIVGRIQSTGQWWVALSNGLSFTNTLWATWNSAVTWVDVQVGDFNGDGMSDIVGRVQSTGQWWVGVSGGSSFSSTLWTSWNSAVTWVDVRAGDFAG